MIPRWPVDLGGFATIAEALDYAAQTPVGLQFFSARGVLEQALSYAQLREGAIAAARRLLWLGQQRPSLGLQRGSRIAIIADTSPGFLTLFYGCQYAGLIPCPLPFITYVGGKDAYVARLAQLSKAAGARVLCTPGVLKDVVGAAADADLEVVPFDERVDREGAVEADGGQLSPLGRDELAYIQFSSGSTALPKGVPITQAAVSNHAGIILRYGMRLTPQDRAFSWLPLYHDMGLFGFSIAPLFGQCPVDYLAPSSFARRPNLWAKLMSQQGSTISYAPTFGYQLAAQRFDESDGVDLSQLRIAGIGGDMIRADVLEQFAERFAGSGFKRSAFMPSYGMAEATLAISFAQGVATDHVDARTLSIGGYAAPVEPSAQLGSSREFVVCGPVIPDHDIAIVDQEGATLGERHVGRILVRGPSLMRGYDNNPAASAPVIGADGFMDTGDLGYLIGDQLVVTGRTKDVMHSRGRNIWPEDIEWIAERIAPLRQGDVAAIAIANPEGEDRLVCLVESHLTDPEQRNGLQAQVAAAIGEAIGIACEVVLVAAKSLPHTSSGKLARGAAREAYLTGAMKVLSGPGAADS